MVVVRKGKEGTERATEMIKMTSKTGNDSETIDSIKLQPGYVNL